MTPAERILLAVTAEKQAKGLLPSTPLPKADTEKVLNTVVGAIIEEEKAKWEAAHKARKKAGIHPDAERVYALYPKRVGKDAALVAITKALQKHPLEYLLDKTNQFARCVADWPQSYRYFNDGADRCPHCASWFNAGRYEDDPKEWKRHGARNAAPPPKQDLPEPTGWREAFPDFVHVTKDWHAIDRASQRYIVEQMGGRATA